MTDVGGSESGTGLRASGKPSRTSDANFEYDDEWDVGEIGNLIIDLDADIEKNNEASCSTGSPAGNALTNLSNSNSPIHASSPGHSSSLTSSITSIKSPQMHIPPASGSSGSISTPVPNNSSSNNSSPSPSLPGKGKSKSGGGHGNSSGELSGSSMDQSEHKGLKMKIKRTKTGTKSGADAKHEIVKSINDLTSSTLSSSGGNSGSSISTSGGSNSGSATTGSVSNKSGGLNDSISVKSAHSSSSHKDKDKIKDGSLIMIDADGIVGGLGNHGASGTNSGTTNNGISKELGAEGKKPRKGKEPHNKKIKTTNGNSKKDERNSVSSSDPKTNSISTSHTKDGKEYFSTTVSLNVPNIVPNASFAKTTLKIPVTSASSSGSIQLNSSVDGVSRNHNHSLSNASPWGASSPIKGADKNSSSTSLSSEKGQGSPTYGKKIRPLDKDKVGNDVTHGGLGLSNIASSYRNSSDATSSSSSIPFNHQGPSASPKTNRSNSHPAQTQDACIGTSVGTVTDPDCLGPCEPGSSVTLEGIVWHENENGILVVNVTWRGKTYVGTLIDCTKNDWAPPRFCDSPTSDLEMRTPKNRAKRGRGQASTPVNEVQTEIRVGNAKLRNGAKGRRGSAANAFVAPASPMKGENWPKRKTRGSENEGGDEPSAKPVKRLKVSKEDRRERNSNSPGPVSDIEKSGGPTSPALIECPEPNCSKKYKHINGLRYHQSHAHNNFGEDSDSNASTTSTQLATPTDAVDRPESEPMDNCDLDGDNTNDDRTSASNGSHMKLDDDHDENARCGKESAESQEGPLSLSGKSANKSGKLARDGEKEVEAKSLSTLNKPILTVPVPFISLQNRPSAHGHSGRSDHDNTTVMKPTPISLGNPSMLHGKGISWQPHHSHVNASNSGHSGSGLNIPSGLGDRRDSKEKSGESHSKKNKHKKKSKDKDGRSKERSDKANKEGKTSSKLSNVSTFETLEGRGSSADDLRLPKRDDLSFSDTTAGNSGDNRDDPQSPAYSDISDANDSGDGDLSIGGGRDGKNPEMKKDGPSIPVTPYFSSFYTPYLDSKIGEKTASLPPEEVEKLKAKSNLMQNLPPGGSGPPTSNPDDSGRSPKMEFPHSKFLPQQHYFPYPYSNYHFEQGHGQFNNAMPENSFNSPRGYNASDEKEKESVADLGKIKIGDIKQEPGVVKDLPSPHHHHYMGKDDKNGGGGDMKSDHGPSFHEPVVKSFACSKHSKDPLHKGDHLRSGLPSDKPKDDYEKDVKEKDRPSKDEGSKPTMETTGPPPPPTAGSYAYLPHQPYMHPGSPFGLHIDPGHPLYRQVLVPGHPYGYMPRYPPPGGPPPMPEDLSRAPTAPPTAPSTAKALDLLQHHAQYYQVHKIHELSERALKSPNSQGGSRSEGPVGPGVSPSNNPTSPVGPLRPGTSTNNTRPATSSSPNNVTKPADLSKDAKPINPTGGDTPPTHHHVHTHLHTHFPVLSVYPPTHSPAHFGVPVPPASIPPFPAQKPPT